MQQKKIEINEQFRKALDLAENTNKNIFITGKAGTGKSTLLDYFRSKTKKTLAVLAPTGVAALNVKGQTIHSFFKFKPNITVDKISKKKSKKPIYKKLNTLIIDEVSMVRADILDCIDKFLRLNGPDEKKLFGGIQMIFIGDLYQLPPVVTSKDKYINEIYNTPYFFSAHVFLSPELEMELIELEKIYRQKDNDFISLLNAIRNRSITENDIRQLNRKLKPDFEPPDKEFYIQLTSTNDIAYQYNQYKLRSLPGKMYRFSGEIEGDFDKSHLPTENILEFKINSQVMMVYNDRRGQYVNGSVGRIAEVIENQDGKDIVLIRLQNGKVVEVARNVWEIFQYRYNQVNKTIDTETVGSFTQYPFRLAWAITIHKSQGKTFDKVIVDIGRGAFACGQVYVALSRCTNFEGIVLKKEIKKHHIRVDYSIINFLTKFQYKISDKAISYKDKCKIIKNCIRNKTRLEIVYLKPNDTKSKRIIKPETIGKFYFNDKEFEGLQAYCHNRKDYRVFRIDRILDLKVVEG